jgi:hypothetical protein
MAVKVVTVLDRQTIWDIAIREYGSVEGVFTIMEDNEGIDLVAPLVVGSLLKINKAPINKPVVDYFYNKNLHPISKIPVLIIPATRRVTETGIQREVEETTDFRIIE